MADYAICTGTWDKPGGIWVHCARGSIEFKQFSELTDTDNLPACSIPFTQTSGWLRCDGSLRDANKTNISPSDYLFLFQDSTQVTLSNGYLRDTVNPIQEQTGQQFIDMSSTGDNTALVEALTNNTESVQFTAGVVTAGILYGVFLYAILKNI